MRTIKPKPAFPKVRKGDVVVIQTTHSSTSISGKVVKWRSYRLARAARCRRDGFVERILKQPGGPEYTLDYNHRTLTIADPEKQAAAARLFDAGGENRWDAPEQVRDAILAEVCSTRDLALIEK